MIIKASHNTSNKSIQFEWTEIPTNNLVPSPFFKSQAFNMRRLVNPLDVSHSSTFILQFVFFLKEKNHNQS